MAARVSGVPLFLTEIDAAFATVKRTLRGLATPTAAGLLIAACVNQRLAASEPVLQPEPYLQDPCPGIPVAFSARRELIAWTCDDGSIRTSGPRGPARSVVKDVFALHPWVTETETAFMLSRLVPPDEQGPARIRRVNLVEGTVTETPLPIPDVEAVDVNVAAGCVVVVTPGKAGRRRVRVYRNASPDDGRIEVAGAATVDLDVEASEVGGVGSPSFSPLRCAGSPGEKPVLFVNRLLTPSSGPTLPLFRLERHDRTGMIVAAQAPGGFTLPSPRATDRPVAIEQAAGGIIDIGVADRLPATAVRPKERRWLDYDPTTGRGLKVVPPPEVLRHVRLANLCVARVADGECRSDPVPTYEGRILQLGAAGPGAGFVVSSDFIDQKLPQAPNDSITSRAGIRWFR